MQASVSMDTMKKCPNAILHFESEILLLIGYNECPYFMQCPNPLVSYPLT